MSEMTFQDPKKKFCEELKAAREYKELEIGRVSEKTKISVTYLERLESGDWAFLPHAYVRAFLRTYARVVGLDVGTVLSQFDDIVDEPSVPVPGMTPNEERPRPKEQKRVKKSKEKKSEPTEEKPNNLTFTLVGEPEPEVENPKISYGNPLYWIIGLAAVAVVAAIAFWPQGETNDPVEEIAFGDVVQEHENTVSGEATSTQDDLIQDISDQNTQTDYQNSANDNPSEEIPPISEEELQPVVTDPGIDTQTEMTLRMVASRECYIKVTLDSDSEPTSDIVLRDGMTRSYTAHRLFTVVLGNAGGVSLTLDGEDLGELGEMGRVVSMTIGHEGIINLRRGVLRSPEEADTTVVERDLTSPVGGTRLNQPEETPANDDTTNTQSEE
jgi:cytoskeleton protein RodZ